MKSCLRLVYEASKSIELRGASPGQFAFFSKHCRTLATLHSRSYAAVAASELQFGQPVHETHPHLLKAGESRVGLIQWGLSATANIVPNSYTRHHCSRICSAPVQTCFQTSEECCCDSSFFRNKISLGCGLL